MSERDDLNAFLHFGAKPCATACTHVLTGQWTALGAANVLSRAGQPSPEPPTRTAEQSHLVALAERDALRQAIWDAYGILGFDQDGDPTPAALTYPPLPDFLRDFATEARKDNDEACDEIDALTAQVEALTAQRDEAVRLLRRSPETCDPDWYWDRCAFLRGVDQ